MLLRPFHDGPKRCFSDGQTTESPIVRESRKPHPPPMRIARLMEERKVVGRKTRRRFFRTVRSHLASFNISPPNAYCVRGGLRERPASNGARQESQELNPSLEGLPSKILCANVLRIHYAHTGATHFNFNSSNNARVSTPVSRIRRAHGLYVHVYTTRSTWQPLVETMSKASERIKAYSCIAPSAVRDGDMLSV